jgi:carbonic anhydrase
MGYRIKEAFLACGLGVAAAILAVSCGGAPPETSSKPAKETTRTVWASVTTRTGAAGDTSATARAKTPFTKTVGQGHASPHWERLGHGGQQRWGELPKDFTVCVNGPPQTLMNIRDTILTPQGRFGVTTLFTADKRTCRCPGSISTPPCTEGVGWRRFKTPVEMSATQTFKGISGFNSRHAQPLNGREVQEEDLSMDS